MVEGQCGTYLRLTRASSGPRVSIAKTYKDETKTKMNISATQWPSSAVEYKSLYMSVLYSTAEVGHCDLAEIFIFVLVSSLYVLETLTRGLDDALVSLR